jgi:hypothetical protein
MTLEIVTTVAASIVALRKHLITMIMNDATTQDKALLIQKILGDITYATTYLKTIQCCEKGDGATSHL